ncbi:MAG: iron-containing alcohol dehydrogenase [Lachnospiraceae bacterium]|nr:iron-containing alcohol dehydrogenase [Lachnospiraceae bacterium]
MKFYIPTKIYSEENCVVNHAAELAAFGKKAMIVTGRHSAKANGSLSDVLSALGSQEVDSVIFDEIEENPSIETVMKAREAGLAAKVDFVIGIGGGSPLDAAKAIAMMIANPDEDDSLLYDATKPTKHLPVVNVPTTAGTGSEATPYSILTIHKKHTKKSLPHLIFPALSLVDGRYLTSISKTGMVNTAVDTLAHLIESYLNAKATGYSRMFAERGLRLWAKEKLLLDSEPADLNFEEQSLLMETSTIGGIAITHTSTSIPHGLSYMLTYEYGIPHGKAVGVFLPGYLRAYLDQSAVEEVLALLKFDDVDQFEKYIRNILGPVDVPKEKLAENGRLIFDNAAKMASYPYPMSEEEMMEICML